MITKITSKLTPIVKQPIRANLQKASAAGLLLLAGSSMSGWHGPSCTPKEMVIPGGLDLKEKAYYLLKGKLPPSVYDRWFANKSDYVPQEGDQVVTVNMYDGRYIGEIVERPHEIGTASGDDIFEKAVGDPIDTQPIGDLIDDGGDDLSTFEIFKHLAGFQD